MKAAAEAKRKNEVAAKLRESDMFFCTEVLKAWQPIWEALRTDDEFAKQPQAVEYLKMLGSEARDRFWSFYKQLMPLKVYDAEFPNWRQDKPKQRRSRPFNLTQIGKNGVNPGVVDVFGTLKYEPHVLVAAVALLKSSDQSDLAQLGMDLQNVKRGVRVRHTLRWRAQSDRGPSRRSKGSTTPR